MASNTRFQKLLEPGYIGKVRTKNRMIKTGQGTGIPSDNGYLSERKLGFYEARAKGGIGLLITQNASILPPPPNTPNPNRQYRIDDDKYIDGYKKLTDTIHKYDCPVFTQMFLSGPHGTVASGRPAIGASTLSKEELPRPQFEPCTGLTVDEIKEITEKFAEAAVRLKTAGYDGVELNAGHSHLFNSFLSRAWNKRDDDYGCQTLENRTRFVVEVLQEIKRRNGQDFPISVLINGREYAMQNGITLEEAKGFAKIFQDAGADAIHMRADIYMRSHGEIYDSVHFPDLAFYPELMKGVEQDFDASNYGEAGFVPLSAAIKQVVSVPVFIVGRMGPESGEQALRDGHADFIAMTRRLQADPELPNKIAEGRLDDIAPCTACDGCFDTVTRAGNPVQCRVNAAVGRENTHGLKPAEKKKKVLVVGGGPAGMEAARVAALRGHEVVLCEKESKLGGVMPMAALVKGTEIEDLPALVRYLSTQIAKRGVDIRLGTEVTPSLVEQIRPDVVILATGGVPTTPDLPGVNRSNVISSGDLHKKMKTYLKYLGPNLLRSLTKFWMPVGKKVVVMGGSIQGCEVAEFLVKRGRQVTVLEEDDTIGEGLLEDMIQPALFGWFADKGVPTIAGVKYEEITDRGLTITTKEGQRQTLEADTVVIALPLAPNPALMDSLKGKVAEIYQIGDCREPNLIVNAIDDGYQTAREL